MDASVRVHSDPSGLPPLPIHQPQGVVYPNGHIRGCWVISQVREAEERGQVTVEAVHQNAIAIVNGTSTMLRASGTVVVR